MTMMHFQPARRVAPLSRTSAVLPDAACAAALRILDHVAGGLVALGISANTVTSLCIALGAGAGVLLAFDQFALATVLMVVASLGDAVDGLVARAGFDAQGVPASVVYSPGVAVRFGPGSFLD